MFSISGVGHAILHIAQQPILFFEKIFGGQAGEAQKILIEVAGIAQKAEPVVAQIDTEVKAILAVNPSGKLSTVEAFLSKYEPDIAKVAATAQNLAGYATSDLYHALAAFAVSKLSPGTGASLVNLAVELGYSLFQANQKPAA